MGGLPVGSIARRTSRLMPAHKSLEPEHKKSTQSHARRKYLFRAIALGSKAGTASLYLTAE